MTERKSLPTMAWHPETGENQIFDHPSEVPEGWLDTHPNNKPKGAKEAKAPAPDAFKDAPMSKDEIVAALTAGGVQFDANAKPKALQGVLREAVVKALTGRSEV
jgi:hypothetical protein